MNSSSLPSDSLSDLEMSGDFPMWRIRMEVGDMMTTMMTMALLLDLAMSGDFPMWRIRMEVGDNDNGDDDDDDDDDGGDSVSSPIPLLGNQMHH